MYSYSISVESLPSKYGHSYQAKWNISKGTGNLLQELAKLNTYKPTKHQKFLPGVPGDSAGPGYWGARAIRAIDGQLIVQYMEHLLKLNCNETSCAWTELTLKLKKGVNVAVAMSLPAHYVCDPNL